MEKRVFKTKNGLELALISRKSAVIFELEKEQEQPEFKVMLEFTSEDFEELQDYIEFVSNKSWTSLAPSEVNSYGSDYYEYYDKNLDNNGYLTLKKNTITILRPTLDSKKLYQFNKRKMESFLFDYKKILVSV